MTIIAAHPICHDIFIVDVKRVETEMRIHDY
ncbi:unnamed protein product, partial [Larinioides sclopetarius]